MVSPQGDCFGIFCAIQFAQQPGAAPIYMHIMPQDYVIMLGTSRRDIGGEAIYDGDIVKGAVCVQSGDPVLPDIFVEKVGLIGWNNELAGWGIFVKDEKNALIPYELDFTTAWKLGNVFENPELLKVSRETPAVEPGNAENKPQTNA